MRTAATLALTRPTSGFWAPLQVEELKEQLSDLSAALICAFNQLLDLKDLNTGVHSTRLAEWAVRVAQELGIEEKSLHDIEVAALLHDIGKVGVPDAILRKPGRLTEEEYALIKNTAGLFCGTFPAWSTPVTLSCIITKALTVTATRLV